MVSTLITRESRALGSTFLSAGKMPRSVQMLVVGQGNSTLSRQPISSIRPRMSVSVSNQ